MTCAEFKGEFFENKKIKFWGEFPWQNEYLNFRLAILVGAHRSSNGFILLSDRLSEIAL